MSRTIDEKVVEMRFDNSDFERNVSQSMSTLDKLKGALNFSGMEKAFDGITSAADRVNFGGLGGALEGIGEKFVSMGGKAIGAFLDIGKKGVDWLDGKLKETFKDLTIDSFFSGFDKYADKTKSVQTIMNATGKTIEEVSEQLDRLMWYTDETSYDFTEMTASIGKFTSAGIDLETAVTSMMGIGNWAGVSGAGKAEANRAMYNISQALSTGFMRKEDWKSIENANMATKEFKEAIIESALALGTLEEYEGQIGVVEGAEWSKELGKFVGGTLTFKNDWENGVDFKNMAATLTEGKWLTNEVLTATLDMYGKFTNELNEVYEDINEMADVSTSQIIKMVNQWRDGTLDMEEAMAMTGKSADELEKIFASLGRDEYALGRKALAAAQEARTFQDAIEATADAVSSNWMAVFERIFGNYEEAKELWTDLANELWEIFAGPISDINDVLTAWRNNDDLGDGRDDLIEGLKNIYRAAKSVVEPIKEAWEAIFPPATYRDIWNFTHGLREFTERLIRSEEQMGRIKESFEGLFSFFKMLTDSVGKLANAFLDPLTDVMSFHMNIGGVEAVKDAFGGFGQILDTIADKAGGFVETVQRVREILRYSNAGGILAPNVLPDLERQHGTLIKILDVYDKISETLGIVGEYLGYALRFGDMLGYYQQAGGGLIGIFKVLVHYIELILTAAKGIIEVWTGIDFSGPLYKVITLFEDIVDALKRLKSEAAFSELKDKFLSIFATFRKEFGSVGSWFDPLKEAVVSVFSDLTEGFGKILGDDGSIYSGLKNVIVLVKGWIDDTNEFIRTNEVLAGVIERIKGLISAIADFISKFYSLSNIVDSFREFGGGLSGVFAVVRYEVSNILRLAADVIQVITGLDLHWLAGILNTGTSAISNLVLGAISAGKRIGEVFDALKERFGSISDWFKPLRDAFDKISGDIGKRLGSMFMVTDAQNGFDFFQGWIDAIIDFVNNSELLGKVVGIFKGLIDVVAEFTSTFFSLQDTIDTFSKGGGGLSGILEVVGEKSQNVVDLIVGMVEAITGLDLGWLSTAFETVFGVIKKVVETAAGVVKGFFGLFKKEETEDFNQFGEETEKRLTPLQTFFEGVKRLFEGFMAVLNTLKPVFEAILGKIGEVFKVVGTSLLEAFKNADIGTVLDWIMKSVKIVTGARLADMFGAIGKPFKEVSGIFSGVKDILDTVKDSLKSWQKDLQAKTLLKIAGAVGILALSVIALSGVDTGKLIISLGAVSAMFYELVAALKDGNKIFGNPAAIQNMATGMLKMSAALLVVSLALSKIGHMDHEQILNGLMGLGLALAELVVAMSALDRWGGSAGGGGATMIAMSASLVIISFALKKIGNMEWESIGKGVVGMTAALGEMTLAMIAMNKWGGGLAGGTAMIEIAASMLLISSALMKIGEMDWKNALTSVGVMAATLILMTTSLIAINKWGGGLKGGIVLKVVSSAILTLSTAFADFAAMDWEAIGRAAVGMGAALLEVGLAMAFMPAAQATSTAIGILAMSAALLALYLPLKLFSAMSLEEIGKSLLAVGGGLLVIGGLGVLLGMAGPALIAGAVGILAISAAIALLGVAMLSIGAGISLLASALALFDKIGTRGAIVLTSLLTQIMGFIPLFIKMIGLGLMEIIKLIKNNAVLIAETVVAVLSAILDAAQVLIPKLVETVLTIIDEILKSLAEHGPSIVESVVSLTLDLLGAIAEHLPEFIQAGIDIVLSLIEGLADGLTNNAERAKEAFENLFDSIIESILIFLGVDKDKAEKFVEVAHDMITGLVSGVAEFATDILTEVGNLMNKIINKVKDKIPDIKEKGREIGEGLKNGISDVKDKVVNGAKALGNAVLNTFDKVFDAHSPSKETEEDGDNLKGGFIESFKDSGEVKNAAGGFADGILGTLKEKFNYNTIFDKLGGNFEDLFASFIEKNGTNGSFEDTLMSFLGQYGMDSYDLNSLLAEEGAAGFTDMYSSQMEAYAPEAYDVNALVAQEGAAGFTDMYTAQMQSYTPEFYDLNASVANAGADGFTGQYTARMEEYVPEAYATGGDIGSASVYGYADSVISTTDEVKPTVQTAMEELSDATTTPIEKGLTEMLSYAEWVAKEYPKGIGEEFSTPVFDFTDLYANMQGGQLEALLSDFDALDEAGRKNLIRAYGLGEQGGSEDLANYLQWYWKNEPIRLQNEEAMARAQEGYQVYLEEQKALQEAQAVQSQQQYEGVQQIAADMQTHTDEFNAKYLAVVEEIKMNVAALREELDGVHEDIVQLNDMYIYLDGDTLVGATAGRMDEKLGNNSIMAGRRVTR